MATPVVSIIMPVYNTEKYLAGAIRSALAQTFEDFELLVVDDESPGNPEVIVAGFDDPRIRFVRHQNGGPAFTRNQGVRLSRGQYVAFLDSDDEWAPEKLARQVALLESRPDVGVVYSQRDTIDESGRLTRGFRPKLHEGFILNELYVDNFICMSSVILRREVFDQCGYIDESLRMSEDFDFWLRVACKYAFAVVQDPLVRYRTHGGQVSRNTEWRIRVVWEIRRNFDGKHGHLVSRKARMRARALYHSGHGFRAELGGAGAGQVVPHYLRALANYPLDTFSYRGLARCVAGRRVMDLYRRLKRAMTGGRA
ncbi:MAG: glycosyltransferase family 2 protein [Acidobacteriota bacterium]